MQTKDYALDPTHTVRAGLEITYLPYDKSLHMQSWEFTCKVVGSVLASQISWYIIIILQYFDYNSFVSR